MLYCLRLFINVNPRGKKYVLIMKLGFLIEPHWATMGWLWGSPLIFIRWKRIKGSRMIGNYSDIDDSCVNFYCKWIKANYRNFPPKPGIVHALSWRPGTRQVKSHSRESKYWKEKDNVKIKFYLLSCDEDNSAA